MILNFGVPPVPTFPPGSLVLTDSKLGHVMIAGRVIGNQQPFLHSEPGIGNHLESAQGVAARYNITAYLPPVSADHGAASVKKMESRLGAPWALVDNCQHEGFGAYFGVRQSPTVDGIAVGCLLALLVLANRD
jgi:hypothetical protein